METYLLWSPSLDEKATTLSFFATAVNIQRIAKGTRDLIEGMLRDLGVHDASFQTWTVERFFTNYLTDDPESDDWQDSWAETWEIVVNTNSAVNLDKNQYYPRRTFEIDRSWDGGDQVFPVDCIVIADFDQSESLDKAQQVFEKVQKLAGDPALVGELKAMVPEADADLFDSIRQQLSTVSHRPVPTVKRRTWHTQQLLISLGTVGGEFFEGGARLASLIAELCQTLGGATTLEETRDS